jgi:hypothetical protein
MHQTLRQILNENRRQCGNDRLSSSDSRTLGPAAENYCRLWCEVIQPQLQGRDVSTWGKIEVIAMRGSLLCGLAWVVVAGFGSAVAQEFPARPMDASSAMEAPAAYTPDELREAAREAIRASRSDQQTDRVVAMLVEAYRQLGWDQQLSENERFTQRQMIRSRLIAVGDKIFEQLKKDAAEKRKAEAKAKRAAAAASSKAPAARAPSAEQTPAPAGSPECYPQPKPSPGNEGQSGGGAQPPDYGLELIELIRTTIAPESWDVAGGLGTIYYYRPVHALVVRQTSEVHWLIGDLREQLGK